MSATYYEICREYHDRMNKIDSYFESVFSNYIDVVTKITESDIFGESYDPYMAEATVEYKLEQAEQQLQEKTDKGTKGIIQTFLDFVQKLVDKVKEFFVGKKVDELEKQVQNDPELRSVKLEGPDAAVIEKLIKQRQKIAEDVVKLYQRKGEALTVEEIDNIVTQRQVAMNEKKMKKRGIILAITGFTTLKKFHGILANTSWYKSIMSKLQSIKKKPDDESSDDTDSSTGTDDAPKDKPKKISKIAVGATVVTGAAAAHTAKVIADLERQNKLLLSGEIQDLTKRLTSVAMNKGK